MNLRAAHLSHAFVLMHRIREASFRSNQRGTRPLLAAHEQRTPPPLCATGVTAQSLKTRFRRNVFLLRVCGLSFVGPLSPC